MIRLLLALASGLASVQEAPGFQADLEAKALLFDVRAWISGEPPEAADIEALRAEFDRLDAERRAISGAEPRSTRDPLAELVRQLGNLGHRLGEVGREAEAHELVRWSAAQAEAHGDLATQSWALEWLGQEAWIHGNLEEAAEWTSHAAEVDELRRAPHDQTRHLADVARIRLSQARFDAALEAVVRAEEAARTAGSSLAERMAAAIHGSLLFELGRLREALELCLAHAPADARDHPRDETQAHLDILAADVLADVGRLESALVFARRALEIASDPEVVRVAPLLHLEAELSLGLLLGDLGHTDEALEVLDAARSEFERQGDARGSAWSAKNRGYVLFAAGRTTESIPDFEFAWRAGTELGLPFLEGFGAIGVAEALVLGSGSGVREDDAARIESALRAAEQVGTMLHDRTLEWRCAALRGRRHLERGEYARSLDELRHAVVLIERWRRRLGVSGLVEHALRQRTDPYRDAAFAAAHLERMDEALAFAGLLQARVLDELRARRTGPLPSLATPALETLRERVVRLEHRFAEEDASEETQTELDRAEDELDMALLTDELAAGRMLTHPEGRMPLEGLGAGLAAQELDLALVYLVGARETLLLRLDAGTAARVTGQWLPVGREQVEGLVQRVRTPMDRLESGELDLAHLGFDAEAARALYRTLIEPLGLAPEARVALVTDDVLATLPFELFVTHGELERYDFARPFAHLAGLTFLGDEHILIRYGSLARIAQPIRAREGRTVVFVAPDDLGPTSAIGEGRRIEHVLRGTHLVLDARPTDVRRETPGASIVHFAAHGRIDPERPAHGSLLLGGEVPGEGARFESWQAAELDLTGALVVLSACHSGQGAWRAGAGLAGLTRGFFLGGAREVVASQWAVDDRVTARFMELFYAERARGSATPEALRAARIQLRTETDPRGFALTHPALWAAWTLEH